MMWHTELILRLWLTGDFGEILVFRFKCFSPWNRWGQREKKRNFQIKFMSLVLVHETEGFRTLQTTLKIQRKLRKHFLPSRKLAPKSCFNFLYDETITNRVTYKILLTKWVANLQSIRRKKSWNFEKLYRTIFKPEI